MIDIIREHPFLAAAVIYFSIEEICNTIRSIYVNTNATE